MLPSVLIVCCFWYCNALLVSIWGCLASLVTFGASKYYSLSQALHVAYGTVLHNLIGAIDAAKTLLVAFGAAKRYLLPLVLLSVTCCL